MKLKVEFLHPNSACLNSHVDHTGCTSSFEKKYDLADPAFRNCFYYFCNNIATRLLRTVLDYQINKKNRI